MVKRIIKSTIDFTIFGSAVVGGTLGLLTLIGFIHWTIWLNWVTAELERWLKNEKAFRDRGSGFK